MKIRKIVTSAVSLILAAALFCACSGLRNGEKDSAGGETASDDVPTVTADSVEPGEIIDLSSPGAADGGVLNIRKAGSYTLKGSLDGYVRVDADGDVTLTLDGAEINCESGPAILISSCDSAAVYLPGGTESVLRSGGSFSLSGDDSNADGTIFSRADLVIGGEGSLAVTSEYKHGIVSKDSLTIDSGVISVTAVKSGIVGKDSVTVRSGSVTVISGTDGIKSTNAEDEDRGAVTVNGGTVNVTSGGDGIFAARDLTVNGGEITVLSGGGAGEASARQDDSAFGGGFGGRDFGGRDTVNGGNTVSDDAPSTKGLKSDGAVTINGGTVNVDSADDSIHGAGNITVNGGALTIRSGDDGIHSDSDVIVSDGALSVTGSYEGIEGVNVLISGGEVSVISSDDGLNAADGSDDTGGRGGPMGGAADCSVEVSGGFVYVNAGGDGVDSNGALTVSGGVLIVSGPVNSANGALDYEGSGTITGGVVMAVGSAGMAMGFGNGSDQPTLMTNVGGGVAGSRVTVCDSEGNVICSMIADKQFQSLAASSPEMKTGEKYTVFIGGECDGEDGAPGGFVRGGRLSGGIAAAEVTLTDNMGQPGNMGPGGMEPGGMEPGGMEPGGSERGGRGGGAMTPPDQGGGMTPPDQGGGAPQIPGGISG